MAGGLDPGAIYALGEGIFAYIDELSAESAEGYAEEQSAAAGERQRLRRRLVRLLAQDPPATEESVLAAAAAASWPLPRTVAARTASTREPPAERRVRPRPRRTRLAGPARPAHRRGGDRRRASSGWRSCSCPTPGAPARARRLASAARGRPAAVGPAVPLALAGQSVRRATATHALLAAGRLGDREFARAEEHLPALVIAADPRARRRARRAAPGAARRRSPRARARG